MILEKIFTDVYQNKTWGPGSGKFNSGAGSNHDGYVTSYVNAIKEWSNQCPSKLSVCDVGCGDFNIGSRIRNFFGDYIACDVVKELVEYNTGIFLDVKFLYLDATKQKLPKSDVIIIRQVLQHLCNNDIEKMLFNIVGNAKYVIITEHVFHGPEKTNLDIPSGPNTRYHLQSYVDVSDPPFNWNFPKKIIEDYNNLITTVYEIGEQK